jgi:glycerol transport system ATP-binding protein
VQIGTPAELFERPEHTFVGYFIGSPGMNFIPAVVSGRRAVVEGGELSLDSAYPNLPADGRVQLGVRPEFVALTASGGLPVTIKRIADLGRKRLAYVNLGPHAMVATVPQDMAIPSERAGVAVNAANAHVYVSDRRVQGAAA